MASTDDYLRLITSQHRGRPRFAATVEALVAPLADLQDFLATVPGAFDLDSAIGAQLDIAGLWVGRSRQVETPLQGVYFSFDTDGLGFDQGNWKGPFDPDAGLVSLDDESYRTLLRTKIAANAWDGTLPSAAKILGSAAYTTTRGTPATYVDAAGVLRTAAPYVVRWNYDPVTGAPTAPIREPVPATNLQASSGNIALSGGIYAKGANAIDLGQVRAPDSALTARRLRSGPSGPGGVYLARFTTLTVNPLTTYTLFVYLRRNAGALTRGTALTVDEYNGTTFLARTNGPALPGLALGDAYQRARTTITTRADTNRIMVYWAGDWDVGTELDIWGCEVKPGNLPATDSFIYTGSGPVTRDADDPQPSPLADGIFSGTGTLVILQDNQDMSMLLGLAGAVPGAVLKALLAKGYIPLKPEGVRANYLVTSADGAPLFGFDVGNSGIAGFDAGAWGVPV